jgi:hypothetical protein
MPSHRPLLVTHRVVEDDGCFWGVVVDSNGEKKKVNFTDMLTMMLNDHDFLVDQKSKDKPAALQVIHRMKNNRGTFYFRTIGDHSSLNNFSHVPVLKLTSAKRIKTLK